MTLEEAVWVDPGRMSGAPCFRGSRLPVQQLFDWLADGVSLDEFIEDFASTEPRPRWFCARQVRRSATSVSRPRRHDGSPH